METVACKDYEKTYALAKLYIRSAMFQLMELLNDYNESGDCSTIIIPDKSHMVKLERGQEELSKWLEQTNILAANMGRPPIEETFFIVSITMPEGNVVYSLESTRFLD